MKLKRGLIIGCMVFTSVFFMGCSQQEEVVPASEEHNVEAVETVPAEEVEVNEETNCVTENKTDKVVDEQLVRMYDKAAEAVTDYFGYDGPIAPLTEDKFNDMVSYYIFYIGEGDFGYQVRVSTEDENVFYIEASGQAMDQLKKAYKEEKGVDPEGWEALDDFKYAQEPADEATCKAIADEFVASTPLNEKSPVYKDAMFEYRYDTQDKEYFVFEYDTVNEQGLAKTVFIKVDAYLGQVVEVTL